MNQSKTEEINTDRYSKEIFNKETTVIIVLICWIYVFLRVSTQAKLILRYFSPPMNSLIQRSRTEDELQEQWMSDSIFSSKVLYCWGVVQDVKLKGTESYQQN